MTVRPSTEAALRKYGRHIAGGCASLRWPAGQPCSCGYEESLAALRASDDTLTEARLKTLYEAAEHARDCAGAVVVMLGTGSGDPMGTSREALHVLDEALAAARPTKSAFYLDSPATVNGVKVAASTAPLRTANDVPGPNGWLLVEIEMDASIVGYAITVNGRDIPITAERSDGAGT